MKERYPVLKNLLGSRLMNDPISDLLNRIKSAASVGKRTVIVPRSRMNERIATVLKNQGYLISVNPYGKEETSLEFVFSDKERVGKKVLGASRISKPSCRVYCRVSDIKPVRHGRGCLVLSTPQGVMTGSEAQKLRVGGEALFMIW